MDGPEQVLHVYAQAEFILNNLFKSNLTLAGHARAVVELALIAGTGSSRERPLAAGGASEAGGRRPRTSRAGLRAGWKLFSFLDHNYLPAQIATLLSKYPELQGQVLLEIVR